jgi:hypothetical protein
MWDMKQLEWKKNFVKNLDMKPEENNSTGR